MRIKSILVYLLLWSTIIQAANPVSDLQLVWPVPDVKAIFQDYAQFHDPDVGNKKFHAGIDIAAPGGSTVVAAETGKVTVYLLKDNEQKTNCLGNVVIIDHGNVATLYAHLSEVNVNTGDDISQGETIGKSGNTAGKFQDKDGTFCDATKNNPGDGYIGYHLHFELKDKAVRGNESNTGKTWSYTPEPGTTALPIPSHHPDAWGYHDPVLNFHSGIVPRHNETVVVTPAGEGVNMRIGPGTQYRSIGAITKEGETYRLLNEYSVSTAECSAWYEVERSNSQYFQDIVNGGQLPSAWICKGTDTEDWLEIISLSKEAVSGFGWPLNYTNKNTSTNGETCTGGWCNNGGNYFALHDEETYRFPVYHPGEDWNVPGIVGGLWIEGEKLCDSDRGLDVVAVANGEVVYSDTSNWGGIIIKHFYQGETWYSQYGHITGAIKDKGDSVKKGEKIAQLGDTQTACAHLHFEIRTRKHPKPEHGPFFPYGSEGLNNLANVKTWYKDPDEFIPSHPRYCSTFLSGDPAHVSSYGTWGLFWNWLSDQQELLLSATCPANKTDIVVGSGNETGDPVNNRGFTYVWNHAYWWDGERWQHVTLDCAGSDSNVVSDNWCKGRAVGEIPTAAEWFIGWTCIWDGNTWLCGCTDKQCSSREWQVQRVKR